MRHAACGTRLASSPGLGVLQVRCCVWRAEAMLEEYDSERIAITLTGSESQACGCRGGTRQFPGLLASRVICRSAVSLESRPLLIVVLPFVVFSVIIVDDPDM